MTKNKDKSTKNTGRNSKNNALASRDPKLMLPDLSTQVLSMIVEFPNFVVGFLVITFGLTWRAQFSAAAANSLSSKTAIQGLSTNRFIAAQILSGNDYANVVLAGYAIAKTAQQDILGIINDPDPLQVLNVRIREIVSFSYSGRNKDMVLHTPFALLDVRVRQFSAIRGTLQSKPVYGPDSLFIGIKPSEVTTEVFCTMYLKLCKAIGLDEVAVEKELRVFANQNLDNPPSADAPFVKVVECILIDIIFQGGNRPELVFVDKIMVGSEDNKLPLEAFLEITRHGPIPLAGLSNIVIDPNKPLSGYASSVLGKQVEVSKDLTRDKNVGKTASKKRGKSAEKDQTIEGRISQ